MRRIPLLLFLICASVGHVFAQDALDSTFQKIEPGESFLKYLNRVEENTNLRFFYLNDWMEPFTMRAEFEGLPLKRILNTQLQESEIQYVFLFNYAVIFYKNTDSSQKRDSLIKEAISNRVTVNKMLIGDPKKFVAGKKVTLTGIVKESEHHSMMGNVSIYVYELDREFLTNKSGKFEMSLFEGEYLVSFRYINYQEKLVNLIIYEDGELNMTMEEAPITLDEVVISDQATTVRRTGQSSIKMNELKRQPTFLGEADIIKSLQVQTGVSTVSEASSGYNVRGGGSDQNLILFDNVPVFSTSHALGFFSAFNADAIGNASFYKGGIPAEYGGRVSSVLSLTAKEGNYQKWKGTGGIGLVSSNFTIGGPVKKDTSSVIVSLRTTYSDWILNLLKTQYKDISDGSVFFYDGSVKYTHKINSRSKFSTSVYASRDKFSLANDTINVWDNLAVSVKYDNTITDNLFYSVGLSLGRYAYEVSDIDPATAFNLNYSATYPSLKIDFNNDNINHKRTFGFHTTYYRFNPGELDPASQETNVKATEIQRESAIESALYFSDAFNWGELFHVEVGLRLSMFNRIGSGTAYTYAPNQPLEPSNTVDSVQYDAGEIMKTYIGPEPRVAVRYTLGPNSSVKLGYNRMYQYVHLISNSASISPVDIWQLSNTYLKPQIADQLSLGYFINSKKGILEAYVEGYYKLQQNVLDFKDGAPLVMNPQLETALLPGKGKAYGVELSVNKLKGRLVGGVNYTYSRSLRKTDGKFDSEKVNLGETYPSNFDQPHIVNVNWKWSFNRRLFFTGMFTYHTGRPVSLPISGYILDGVSVSDFSDRNNYRVPDYHRLDFALVLEGSNRRNRKFEGNWSLSIYNVYGRKNPYSVFLVPKGSGILQPYQLSLIGTPVPSLTYSFKF
ncbi:MAG TPA: carboxypeptidase-like regulatory domain-containing protein [Cyclobacteriaceae bacterium]|nr:carboxypeptidase-like regulatory domain-containing protein [Cyclobacteriaceae bacterium]